MKLKVNENFFKIWSSDMAYILGVTITDGCLVEYKNGYHGLDITNKDKDFLGKIRRTMQAEHKISRKNRGYRLQIRNKNLYNDLLLLGLTPRKTHCKIFPVVPKKYLSDFIRGCFDGDGTVFIWKEPRWRHTWQIRSTFSSGSIKFLNKLRTILQQNAGLSKGYLQFNRRFGELKYSISDSSALYRFLYRTDNKFLLERKKKVFESFFKLRNNWKDSN